MEFVQSQPGHYEPIFVTTAESMEEAADWERLSFGLRQHICESPAFIRAHEGSSLERLIAAAQAQWPESLANDHPDPRIGPSGPRPSRRFT